MALLVCFCEKGSEVDWRNKAIYLDQRFYGLLFDYYRKRESDSALKAMVALGYGDEYVIPLDRLSEPLDELRHIASEGVLPHPQVDALASVFIEAASRKLDLAISGDMYPDLSRE